MKIDMRPKEINIEVQLDRINPAIWGSRLSQ